MKAKIALSILLFASLPAGAVVTLEMQMGAAFDSGSTPVSDGDLWALVVDTDNNSTFTGFGLNGTMNQASANLFFTIGQSLSLGTVIGGNTIFAMGAFNGDSGSGIPGLTVDNILVNYGTNGTAAGLNVAFYWFPGTVYTGGASETIENQVGGMNSILDESGVTGLQPMVLPTDGVFIGWGAANADGGGSLPNASFTAVNLIPEPSAALLGSLGVLVLLRRRRN
jgi:hypothetical protein